MQTLALQNLIFVTSLHIIVDIVAMFIMIAEFLEWQFELALFAVRNVCVNPQVPFSTTFFQVFPVTYTVVILNSVTIVITNKRVRDEYIVTLIFWKKKVEDRNTSSRQLTSVAPSITPNLAKVQA